MTPFYIMTHPLNRGDDWVSRKPLKSFNICNHDLYNISVCGHVQVLPALSAREAGNNVFLSISSVKKGGRRAGQQVTSVKRGREPAWRRPPSVPSGGKLFLKHYSLYGWRKKTSVSKVSKGCQGDRWLYGYQTSISGLFVKRQACLRGQVILFPRNIGNTCPY